MDPSRPAHPRQLHSRCIGLTLHHKWPLTQRCCLQKSLDQIKSVRIHLLHVYWLLATMEWPVYSFQESNALQITFPKYRQNIITLPPKVFHLCATSNSSDISTNSDYIWTVSVIHVALWKLLNTFWFIAPNSINKGQS